ncbi:DUF308 domain-containing protein [Flavobacteriaceae bacterium F89]|uniref:DUF308 domain-containing protein n=1 Tax=Cerina litoralis TaxID=2874477 RepID=A0AAE3EUM5_9FLAO|nr:DUF308 domain-containing protein [Cerina litoralis]MCG2460046.1 DUF308 domain-containing protein [Cerina litoralis]
MAKTENIIYASLLPENKKWRAYLLVGCLFILIGLWIFMTPTASFLSLSLFFSLALIVFGAFEVVFSIKIIRRSKNWLGFLARGLFDLVIGTVLLFNPFSTVNLLPYLLATWIIYRSIRAILFAYRLKSYGIKKWYRNLAFGAGILVVGLILLAHPVLGVHGIVYRVAGAFTLFGFFNFSKAYQLNKLGEQDKNS